MVEDLDGDWVRYVLRKARKDTDTDIPELIREFCRLYRAKTRESCLVNGRMGMAFKAWKRIHSAEKIKRVMSQFFDYPKRKVFSFARFQRSFDDILPFTNSFSQSSSGWKCPKCSYLNNHTGGFCLQCRFEPGGTDE